MNTYFEVLKQVGFDSLIAQKINEYRKHHIQKLVSVIKFYNYLNMYNIILDIRQEKEYINLNPIQKYYVLYNYSTFLEEFMFKMKVILDCIIKRFKYTPLKLHMNYQTELELGYIEIITAKAYCELYWNTDFRALLRKENPYTIKIQSVFHYGVKSWT